MTGSLSQFRGEVGMFDDGDLAMLVSPRRFVKPRIFYDVRTLDWRQDCEVEPGPCVIRRRVIRACGSKDGTWGDTFLVVTHCGRIGWVTSEYLAPLEVTERDPFRREPDPSRWPEIVVY